MKIEWIDCKTPSQLLCIFMLCGFAAFASATADVFVVVRMENDESSVIGQKRLLWVDIYTSTWFKKAPTVLPFKIEGAITMEPGGFGINFSERREGQQYAVQRREYLVFPQQAGDFVVPAISLKVIVADDSGRSLERELASTVLAFNVVSPPAASGTAPLLVASAVTLTESYSELPLQVRVGDGVVRRISVEADDSLGMLIPPLVLPDLAGVRFYRRAPEVSDRVSRGEYRGLRIETHTYVFDRSGSVILPSLTLRWWNTDVGAWESSSLPGRTFNVLTNGENPEIQPGTGGDLTTNRYTQWSWMVGLGLIVIAVTLAFAVVYRRFYTRVDRTQGYRRLLRACRMQDVDAIVKWLYVWKTQQSFEIDGELLMAIRPIWQSMYGTEQKSRASLEKDCQRLVRAIKAHRQQLLRQNSLEHNDKGSVKVNLAELNPRGN